MLRNIRTARSGRGTIAFRSVRCASPARRCDAHHIQSAFPSAGRGIREESMDSDRIAAGIIMSVRRDAGNRSASRIRLLPAMS
jgi:hypothetical protein